ncbi:Smr/MutS family protein [Candidatus Peregrinibacteria bacterium]|nr:Smr/MutS family protein [Candidatus Peregrinibacteria bacterium]
MVNNDDMDDIIDAYTTESDVNSALEEKNAGEFNEEESINETIKDYPSPQREIDLHQKTSAEAISEIGSFIHSANKQNLLTVRIITGKGTGILLNETEKYLSSLKRDGQILRFQKEKTGGSFIVYI